MFLPLEEKAIYLDSDLKRQSLYLKQEVTYVYIYMRHW